MFKKTEKIDNVLCVQAELMPCASVIYIHCPKCQSEDIHVDLSPPLKWLDNARFGGQYLCCPECNTTFAVKGIVNIPIGREVSYRLSPLELSVLMREHECGLDNECRLRVGEDGRITMRQGDNELYLYDASLTFKQKAILDESKFIIVPENSESLQ